MSFQDLGLAEPICRAVAADGYTAPTPIQAQAIPHVLGGGDLIGCAQTGTGKTGAFALPILHRLHQNQIQHKKPRVLVLCPTRELASQISQSFVAYGRHLRVRNTVVFGGVNQFHQVRSLKQNPEVLIATPGRLLDLMNQGLVDLSGVEILVLDEADRMLDMGFIHDIRKIIKRVPQRRQTLFFSATMPDDIRALADSILHKPKMVRVNPVGSAAEAIEQNVYFVVQKGKSALLKQVLGEHKPERTLIFTRTKHGADRVAKDLKNSGMNAIALHGNKSQNARTAALKSFKSNRPPILVATDIASRGIDVDGISLVINFDVPNVPETYVHRIGRTARAGASGRAISFCGPEERGDLKAIERLMQRRIAVIETPSRIAAASNHDKINQRLGEAESPRHSDRKLRAAGHATHASQMPHSSRPAHAPGFNAHKSKKKHNGMGWRGRGKQRVS